MVGSIRTVRVFYSFPEDMAAYVEAAQKVVDTCNRRWERDYNIGVRSITFRDLPSSYDANGVQEYLLSSIFGEFDVYCGLMGARFGSPSGKFGSGTEEEYQFALAQHETSRKIKHVMFGFCEEPVNPFQIDTDQLAKTQAFRRAIGKHQLYFIWSSRGNFDIKFEQQIDAIINKFANDPNYFIRGGVKYR